MSPALQGLITIIIGVAGCVGYFYASNAVLDKVIFPPRARMPAVTSIARIWCGRGSSCSLP